MINKQNKTKTGVVQILATGFADRFGPGAGAGSDRFGTKAGAPPQRGNHGEEIVRGYFWPSCLLRADWAYSGLGYVHAALVCG